MNNQPKRSRRRKTVLTTPSCRSNRLNPQEVNLSTPPPIATSIHETARNPSYSGSLGSTPQSGSSYAYRNHRTNLNSNVDNADAQDNKPRYCYCNGDHEEASTDGFFCSGPCGRWFHAKCTGWNLVVDDGEDDDAGNYIQASFGEKLKIPISFVGQSLSPSDDKPWYCIKCWEEGSGKKSTSQHWNTCNLEEKCFWLGHQSEDLEASLQIQKYVRNLWSVIDTALLDTILNKKPRPFPIVKPMNPVARRTHACQGRRFEIVQLAISVSICDCCGRTQPFASDP